MKIFLSHFLFFFLFTAVVNGQPAPDFTFTNAVDGTSHTLYEDYLDKGKTVLIELFFTTCPSCRPYAPLLEPLYQQWGGGDGDVEFMSFSTQSFDTNEAVATYQIENGHTFLAAGDDGNGLNIARMLTDGTYGPYLGTPTFILVDPDGTVHYRVRGSGVQGTIDALDTAIAASRERYNNPNDMEEVMPVNFTISGQVKNGENGVSGVNVSIVEQEEGTTLSADAGLFNLNTAILPDSTYHLNIAKLNASPTEGVTTFDIILVRKHILNIEAFDNPWAILAADVNNSGNISTFDIVLIRKAILDIGEPFLGVPVWRFFPADYEFSNPQAPSLDLPDFQNFPFSTNSNLSNLNIRAVKTGDVNFSAKE